MNKQANILFNIDSSISGNWLALQEPTAPHSSYQRLIYASLARSFYTTKGLQVLGRQLAEIAHRAYFVRQIETVDQASRIMLALPISRELKGIAHYYQAICAKRKGDFDNARLLLEYAVEEAPLQYRARIWLTIGATHFDRGEVDASLPFFSAAGRDACEFDFLTLLESQRGIAIVHSIYGDHKQALSDLEKLLPHFYAIAKRYPPLYYDYLNSLAVELGEVGCVEEAQAACAITLASPFSAAYPNWVETRDELEAKRTAATPSVVAIHRTPEPAPQAQAAHQTKPICTLAFRWLARKKSVIQITMAIALAIPLVELLQTVLDRVRFCIQPRGPPCCC